jgi:cysteine desulfurase / selenocysteine lyase
LDPCSSTWCLAAPSGAHDPASAKSYPFGEPIVEGALNGAYTISTASPVAKNLPHIEVVEGPEFYFLDSRTSTGASASPARESIPTLSVFDVEAIRRDFPVLNQNINGHRIIWLDNAATTQKPRKMPSSLSSSLRISESALSA